MLFAALCLATDPRAGATADQPAAADDAALATVMSRLSQRRHGEADFTEEKYLAMLKAPVRSAGRLVYDAPDHLEERTLSPRPQSVVLDHGVLTMQNGKRSRSLALADYPQFAPLIDSIRATLAGDRPALEKAFELKFSGDLEHWNLHLEPRDPQLRTSLKQIELTGAQDAVSEVRIEQRNGDHSLMHITPRE
jgi:hypothetical protein